ncbi:hypothetical protein N308_03312, partial [Struthio camelus australis]
LLHVMLHSLLLLLLLLLLGVPNALGLLKLVVVGHPRPQGWACSLLLLLLLVALLLDHLVPPHEEVSELGSHPRVIHVHLLRLRIHPSHGLLRLLLRRRLLRHAGPLHSCLHGAHVLHGWVGVHPSLLRLHVLLWLEPRLTLGDPSLTWHPLGVLGPCVLGSSLLDES